MKATALILIAISVLSTVYTKEVSAISRQISANNSSLSAEYVERIAKAVDAAAKKYSIPAKIYAAILMQESRYNVEAKNCKMGLRFLNDTDRFFNFTSCTFSKFIGGPLHAYKVCQKEFDKYTKEESLCTDIGMSQIHINTIKEYNFDPHRLSTDIEYSINAGAQVLSFFKKQYSKHESNWWSRYNSSDYGARAKYEQLVRRFIR